jgi:hypothetical protein
MQHGTTHHQTMEKEENRKSQEKQEKEGRGGKE